jgi:hypothetical protein
MLNGKVLWFGIISLWVDMPCVRCSFSMFADAES